MAQNSLWYHSRVTTEIQIPILKTLEEARHLPTYPLKQLPRGISTLVPADAVHLPNSICLMALLSQVNPALLLKEALQEGVIGLRDIFLLSVSHYCLLGSLW